MEATTERTEQRQRESNGGAVSRERTDVDPTVKSIIRESIVDPGGAVGAREETESGDRGSGALRSGDGAGALRSGDGGGAREPDDILAFSRSVRNIDSSLE